MAPPAQKAGKKIKFTAADYKLMEQSQTAAKPSTSSSLFTAVGLITGALPAYIFAFILHGLSDELTYAMLAVTSVVSGVALSTAYQNNTNRIKPTVTDEIEKAIHDETKQKNKELKKEEISELSQKKTEVAADHQATLQAILESNMMFLGLVMFFMFFFAANYGLWLRYIVSVAGSSGIVLLLSTGSAGKSKRA